MAEGSGLLAAVQDGDAHAVSRLLGAQPELARSAAGTTAVALAARLGQVEALRALLAAGAGTDSAEGEPRPDTPLMAAAAAGQAEAIAVLLEHGADPSLRDAAGRSAADHARVGGHAELAARLGPDTVAERVAR